MVKKTNVKNLTPKQKRFCELYAVNNNSVQSAKKTGYKNPFRQSKNLLSKTKVKQYVAQLREIFFKKYQVSAQYCIANLKKIFQMAMQEKDFRLANQTMDRIAKFIVDDNLKINQKNITINITKD